MCSFHDLDVRCMDLKVSEKVSEKVAAVDRSWIIMRHSVYCAFSLQQNCTAKYCILSIFIALQQDTIQNTSIIKRKL
jgi:hypothetical protein